MEDEKAFNEHLEGDRRMSENDQLDEGYAPADIQKNAHQSEDPAYAAEYKRYMRKLDLIICPMISLLYFFEYLDRGNVANAKLYGLASGHATAGGGTGPGKKALTSVEWREVIMIVYVGLVLCQVPGCIGYRIFPPSKWIAFGVCGWAAVSMLQCVAPNLASLLVCRVFLGAFEGLFGTGIVYYLSLWYKRGEMGMRVFWFLGPTALAGAFGGLIAYGAGHIDSSTPAWKWLFLIEGLPCFCLGLLCLWWMPDRPLKNSRFSGKQQKIAVGRYYSEEHDKAGAIQWRHVVWTVSDWRLYAQVAVYAPTAALLASISGFLPTIVTGLGYKSATSANLMTVPVYAVAFVVMMATSYLSDRYRTRGVPIVITMVIGGICYALLAVLPETALRGKYACVCLSTACVYATYPPSHAWAANNFGNETKRAIGMGLYTALGNLGSIAGSWIYDTSQAPQFRQAHFISMALCFFTALAAGLNSLVLHRVNVYRDRKFGKTVPGAVVEVTELADRSPHYRFMI